MPNIFGGASRAAIVRVTCPSCGEVQARARGPQGTQYACRKCGATFSDADGVREDERLAAARQRRRS